MKHPARWVAGVGAVGGLLWWLTSRFIPVKVEGPSMLPTLRPGDWLLVDTKGRVEVGAIIVARAGDDREIVKRVSGVDVDGSVEVTGDNRLFSTDSRAFGTLPATGVVGVVRLARGRGRPLAWF